MDLNLMFYLHETSYRQCLQYQHIYEMIQKGNIIGKPKRPEWKRDNEIMSDSKLNDSSALFLPTNDERKDNPKA